MSAQLLAYPFLFIAIFFESFILVTFLSAPAKRARTRIPSRRTPSVAVIVPCWNEAETVARTTESLLALEYPAGKLSVILVDNNSTDGTAAAMARFAGHPQVTILSEKTPGKHNAVNAGIAATSAEFVGCLDADSFVEPGALRQMIGCFDEPSVAAATAAMSIHKPKNLLQHMQNAEYIYGILLKHALSTVDGIHVTPGPFSLYRRAALLVVGGFRAAYQTEDLEMALRLQKAGYRIENAPYARVYTKAPDTVRKLLRQRTRWTAGFIRNVLKDYRDLIGNRRYGALGLIVLPISFPAMAGAVLTLGTSLALLGVRIAHAYEIRTGIPLSYAALPHLHFDWFYAPTSLYLALAAVAVAGALLLIGLGKQVSKTPGALAFGLFSYLFLYGFLAPLWLLRAASDVALGKKRAWR